MCLSVSLQVELPREAEPGPRSQPPSWSQACLFKAPCPGTAGLAGHCNCTVASTAFLALNSGAAVSERLFSESGLDFPLGGALGVLTKAEKGNKILETGGFPEPLFVTAPIWQL